ncbi:hypothetical protein BD408DRAFT_216834 [Parasitella parasitica]|nr:hypothetical protein BD408DRAFT_216834 [Parasitella parasitica]
MNFKLPRIFHKDYNRQDQASMDLRRRNPISRTNRNNSNTRQICHWLSLYQSLLPKRPG